jgi:flagellar basal-body rod protein FlgF
MSYGIKISASGALAAMHRQDALTANLANLNTVGFKPVLAGAMHRDPVRQEDGLANWDSDALLERLGGGVLAAPTMIDFGQGPLEITDQALDIAIQGEGFFVVGDPADPSLTRDGRMTMRSDGTLVLAGSGLAVLGTDGRAVRVDPAAGPAHIATDGVVSQDGGVVGRIRVADVADRDVLVKVGAGLFAGQDGQRLALVDGTGMVRQGAVEGSGVDEIDALMQIQNASRAAQSNIGMIDMQNRMLDRLVNTFGRTV